MPRPDHSSPTQLDRDLAELRLLEIAKCYREVLDDPSANYSIPYSQAKLRIADTNPPNLNIPDQILAPTDVRVRNLVFDASDAGAQSFSFSIVSVGVSTLAQDAYSLDQSLNLTKYPDAQGYRFNIHGLSEKWLYNGSTIWYYILPDGRLFKLLGSSPNPSSDTLQDELSPIVWSRPQLLDSAVSAQSRRSTAWATSPFMVTMPTTAKPASASISPTPSR